MKATRRRPKKTFEELISGYYGKAPSDVRTLEDVISNYYGLGRAKPRAATGAAMTLSRDDGEVLPQKPTEAVPPAAPEPPAGWEEYVVWTVEAPTAAPAPPVPLAPPPGPAPAESVAAAASALVDVPPSEEYALDVLRPLEQLSVASSGGPRTVEEDELAADMQAILSGQKVYDPATGQTVDRDRVGTEAPPPAPAAPLRSNEHAIFDAIAESMTYANAYDLGTVELENRFATFDQTADSNQEAMAAKAARTGEPGAPLERPKVGSADFLEDIDAIRERAEDAGDAAVRRAAESMPIAYSSSIAGWSDAAERDAICSPSVVNLALVERDPSRAEAMWDAGEHALAGGDLYRDQLRVGRNPGVAFSYGELIAMGDLYESVDQMMNADPAELSRLKALIDRNTSFYQTNKRSDSLDVGHGEWDTATGGRYLKLAEDNYEHFSPNTLFTDAVAKAATRHGTNRSAWEAHHRRAIEEAQKLALRPENQNRSYIPEWPLIVNAFGDHFLTDAFASGHLINKELMIAYFRQNFFSGSDLNSAAKDFFKRVAAAAFVGKVKEKFSELETVDYPVCAWGWCFKWRPNIDSAGRFGDLLTTAAKQEPVKVANFAVKALHDHLNEHGIEVTNAAGDGTWLLTGDGFLDPNHVDPRHKSLAVMRKAVQQSVDNINDPAILASNLNFGPFFERVWRYVPQPTAGSRTRLVNLVQEYTNPRSTVLSDAAAQVISKQVDALITVLLKEKKLKRA